jgi:putative protein-disulfide isomerase
MNTPSAPISLIYVGDPMCSWCYGFGVPLGQLLERFPEVPVQLVLGGLRAYNTQVMDASLKDKLRQAWANVAQRSGQPFSQALFDRDDFVYDTEPACRAVITVRQHAPALALAMYHAIQQAFYADGRDVTKAAVLGEVWDEVHGRSKQAWGHIDFLRDFESAEIRQLTRDDFAQAQRWGVRGFPALLALHDGQLRMIAGGYTDADTLIEALPALAGPRDRAP